MTEENQVQCPNCGGYKITGSQITEKLPKKEYRSISPLLLWGWRLCFVVATFTTFGVYLLVLLIPDIRRLTFSGLWPTITKVVGFNHICMLCNYRWSWMIGTPKPEVHVRPDLMMKGAQKLQEEEEERRRQQD